MFLFRINESMVDVGVFFWVMCIGFKFLFLFGNNIYLVLVK